ncbi:MAG: AbrB/MazE/SpoVT family DNA-binding domain-containing protein [Pseudobutyrivibrio ruminis]|nr:AbrB/MazE/SpoVT family DNA-binding domain-containing protein [Pseudobutyrivibrio ruminis]
MQVAVSKWGNSLGIRIPANVISALSIKNGDNINYELRDNELILRKEMSTREMFEQFYHKPMEEITLADVGSAGVIDWGDDVGGELF